MRYIMQKPVIDMWKYYNLIFEANAPIHIGYKKFGIVTRTRYYILGRNFWGAVTATLTRDIMKNYDSKIYQRVGEFIKENIIFTHFYIYEDGKVLYPKFSQNGLKYGELSQYAFEKKYISSYVSTALETSSRTAEEESLHEIEFIKPRYKENGRTKATTFFGHMFINGNPKKKLKEKLEDKELGSKVNLKNVNFSQDKVKELLSEVWVGGERNYGFGRIKLKYDSFEETKKVFKNNEFELIFNDKKPTLKSRNNEIVALSHVVFDNKIKNIRGDIEPLVGKIWNEKGTGQKTEFSNIALVPGTKFKYDGRIEIGDCGIWKII